MWTHISGLSPKRKHMEVRSLSAFWANIYVGLKETPRAFEPAPEYDGPWPVLHSVSEVERVCQEYCDEKGFCVSVTPTKYIYTRGNEPGVIVGVISYPRFPSDNGELRRRALELAEKLRTACGQYKVSVMMPSEVVMLGVDRD